MVGAVCVGADDKLEFFVFGLFGVYVIEVESVGEGVDFHDGVCVFGGFKDVFDVDVVGVASSDESSGGVCEDVCMIVSHGVDDASVSYTHLRAHET